MMPPPKAMNPARYESYVDPPCGNIPYGNYSLLGPDGAASHPYEDTSNGNTQYNPQHRSIDQHRADHQAPPLRRSSTTSLLNTPDFPTHEQAATTPGQQLVDTLSSPDSSWPSPAFPVVQQATATASYPYVCGVDHTDGHGGQGVQGGPHGQLGGTTASGSSSALLALPRDQRLSFGGATRPQSRIEAMRLATQQAVMREAAARETLGREQAVATLERQMARLERQIINQGGPAPAGREAGGDVGGGGHHRGRGGAVGVHAEGCGGEDGLEGGA